MLDNDTVIISKEAHTVPAVTLHVGVDTFRPITSAFLAEHKMHSEWCQLTAADAQLMNDCRSRGGRLIARDTPEALRSAHAAASLFGDAGWDTMTGGSGTDLFDFGDLTYSTDSARDIITDFANGDIIDFTGLGFTGIQAGAGAGTVLGFYLLGGNTIIGIGYVSGVRCIVSASPDSSALARRR